MVSYSCFPNLFPLFDHSLQGPGRTGKEKALVPCFAKRQRPCNLQALCGTTLVDVPCTPPHGLPAKSCTVTAATGAAYKDPAGPVQQAAPGRLPNQNALCLAASGSSLDRWFCVVLFPIHAFVDVNYTINRAFVNRQFVFSIAPNMKGFKHFASALASGRKALYTSDMCVCARSFAAGCAPTPRNH